MDDLKKRAIENAVGVGGNWILSFLASSCATRLNGYPSDHHAVCDFFGITIEQYEEALGYKVISDAGGREA